MASFLLRAKARLAATLESPNVAGGDLLLRQTLHANAYDLTFRQVEEKTGFPKSTVQRWMKKNKWRVVGKEWAQEHLNNNWDLSLGRHRREVVLRVLALGQAQAAAGRREAQAEDQVEALHRQGDDALRHCQAV